MFLFSECSALPFNRNPTDREIQHSVKTAQFELAKMDGWNFPAEIIATPLPSKVFLLIFLKQEIKWIKKYL